MWLVNESSDASSYAVRPWQSLYEHECEGDGACETPSDILSAFERCVERHPDQPSIVYFDRTISFAELDELSEAFAAVIFEKGFGAGDRMALYLQNVPQFPIAALAAWKLGGVVVPINPMNTARELGLILADSRPEVLVVQDDLYRDVVSTLYSNPPEIFSTSTIDLQSRNDPRVFGTIPADGAKTSDGVANFLRAIESKRGYRVPRAARSGRDVAMIVYTSGTTGVPKGSMNTHFGAVATAGSLARWFHIERGEPILGIAPLFHITGLVAGIVLSFVRGSRLVLSYRFQPSVVAQAIEDNGAVVAFCAITALIALMNDPDVTPAQLKSLTKICTGGAPMAPAVLTQFREKFGVYIYHGYGMTETNGPAFLVPAHLEAPIDEVTGALSVGVPTPHTAAWIAGDDGRPVPPGDIGEVVIGGHSVTSGYWEKPDETGNVLRPDGLRSGDIGFMDANGWFYLVDRKKDMINAGGYKVWPREIEDVLYTHPAVREAAVIGVPDPYRGETVKAIVSLKRGSALAAEELRKFCKERMAAYKYPRLVEIVPELPKNSSGKILKRSLQDKERQLGAADAVNDARKPVF